jgi:hypothetical protein
MESRPRYCRKLNHTGWVNWSERLRPACAKPLWRRQGRSLEERFTHVRFCNLWVKKDKLSTKYYFSFPFFYFSDGPGVGDRSLITLLGG